MEGRQWSWLVLPHHADRLVSCFTSTMHEMIIPLVDTGLGCFARFTHRLWCIFCYRLGRRCRAGAVWRPGWDVLQREGGMWGFPSLWDSVLAAITSSGPRKCFWGLRARTGYLEKLILAWQGTSTLKEVSSSLGQPGGRSCFSCSEVLPGGAGCPAWGEGDPPDAIQPAPGNPSGAVLKGRQFPHRLPSCSDKDPRGSRDTQVHSEVLPHHHEISFTHVEQR